MTAVERITTGLLRSLGLCGGCARRCPRPTSWGRRRAPRRLDARPRSSASTCPAVGRIVTASVARLTSAPRVSARERFAKNLRAARKAKGLSQEALGGLADLHPTYVGSVERGRSKYSCPRGCPCPRLPVRATPRLHGRRDALGPCTPRERAMQCALLASSYIGRRLEGLGAPTIFSRQISTQSVITSR
jgi:hypothetical protein